MRKSPLVREGERGRERGESGERGGGGGEREMPVYKDFILQS